MRLLRCARNDEAIARNDEAIARNDRSRRHREERSDEAIWLLLTGLLLILSATATHASDRSIRCGQNLVHAGGGKDSSGMYEVLKKCGEPVTKHGNTWIYEQGNMRRILTFNYEGRLLRIESRKK